MIKPKLAGQVPFDLAAAKRAAQGPDFQLLGERILDELAHRIGVADRVLHMLDQEMEGLELTDQKTRKDLREKKARLLYRRRTLIEIWEFAVNRVWHSEGGEGGNE